MLNWLATFITSEASQRAGKWCRIGMISDIDSAARRCGSRSFNNARVARQRNGSPSRRKQSQIAYGRPTHTYVQTTPRTRTRERKQNRERNCRIVLQQQQQQQQTKPTCVRCDTVVVEVDKTQHTSLGTYHCHLNPDTLAEHGLKPAQQVHMHRHAVGLEVFRNGWQPLVDIE